MNQQTFDALKKCHCDLEAKKAWLPPEARAKVDELGHCLDSCTGPVGAFPWATLLQIAAQIITQIIPLIPAPAGATSPKA